MELSETYNFPDKCDANRYHDSFFLIINKV
jgi:hypothetical protein